MTNSRIEISALTDDIPTEADLRPDPGTPYNPTTDNDSDRASAPTDRVHRPLAGPSHSGTIQVSETQKLTLGPSTLYDLAVYSQTTQTIATTRSGALSVITVTGRPTREAAPTFDELLQVPPIPYAQLNGTGYQFIPSGMLEISDATSKRQRLDTEIEYGEGAIYTVFDLVGSTNMFSTFFNQNCPASLRSKFIDEYGQIIEAITTIAKSYYGSVEQFQGDAVMIVFQNQTLALTASYAIQQAIQASLQRLKKYIQDFNNLGYKDQYKSEAGLRIMHVDGSGYRSKLRTYASGAISSGPPLKLSNDLEKMAKQWEESEKKKESNQYQDINIFVLINGIFHVIKLNNDAILNIEKHPQGLRLQPKHTTTLREVIEKNTSIPSNEAALEHPYSTNGVPVFINFPNFTDTLEDQAKFDNIRQIIANILTQYRGKVHKDILGKGLLVTFENGNMTQLAIKALSAAKKTLQEHPRLTGQYFAACIGTEGMYVRVKAGNQHRYEETIFGPGVNATARGLYIASVPKAKATEQSVIVCLSAADALGEYCYTGDTMSFKAKGFKENLTACEIRGVKQSKRAVLISEHDQFPLIGQQQKELFTALKRKLKSEPVVTIRGNSPVYKLIMKNLIQTDDDKVCLVKPEGQDIFEEYKILKETILALLEGDFSIENQYILRSEALALLKAIESNDEKTIIEMITTYLTEIASRQKGVLYITILEANKADDKSKLILEKIILSLKNANIKLIILGNNIQNPDIKEDLAGTVSETEAKKLIRLILEKKVGTTDTTIINDEDLDLIIQSLPFEIIEKQKRINSTNIPSWLESLIKEGILYQASDPTWEVNKQKIDQKQFNENNIFLEILKSLEEETPGITNMALAYAIAGRAIPLSNLQLNISNKEQALKKLIEYGILLKVEPISKKVNRKNIELVAENAFVLNPIFSSAAQECTDTSSSMKRQVHSKILSGQFAYLHTNTARQLTTTMRMTTGQKHHLITYRNIYLSHCEEYFKNYNKDTIGNGSIKVLQGYLETLLMIAKEELQKGNFNFIATKLQAIHNIQDMFTVNARESGEKSYESHLLLDNAKTLYLELMNLLLYTSHKSGINNGIIIDATRSPLLLQVANNLIASDITDSEEEVISLTTGLIVARSFSTRIRAIKQKIEYAKTENIQSIATELNATESIKLIINEGLKYYKIYTNKYFNQFESLNTTSQEKVLETIYFFASVFLNSAFAISRINDQENTQENINHITTYLERAEGLVQYIIEQIDKSKINSQKSKEIKGYSQRLKYYYIPECYNAKLSADYVISSGSTTHQLTETDLKMLSRPVLFTIRESNTSTHIGTEENWGVSSYIERINTAFYDYMNEIHSLMMEKQKGTIAKIDTTPLINFSESIRLLGRKLHLTGHNNKYITMLKHAISACNATNEILNYDFEKGIGNFLLTFIITYNQTETYIELAFASKIPKKYQRAFDQTIHKLHLLQNLKLPREILHGVNLKEELQKLYTLARKAGLNIPDEYKEE